MSPCATRHHRFKLSTRRSAAPQPSMDVLWFPVSTSHRPRSGRPCNDQVRGKALGVCVARWYDPGTGEFVSVDPDLAETGLPYAYASDDPVNNSDPTGAGPAPGCGPGANVRKVVQTYSAKRFGRGGYMTATLYCGNDGYGYRHLLNHISEFGYAGSSAWTLFSNAIAATLRTPQTLQYQEANDTYLYKGPWTNVNYGEDIQIGYLFFTIINPTGTIITAYARPLSTSPIPGIPTLNDQTTQCALN